MKATQLVIILGSFLASGVVSTSEATAADLQYHRRAHVPARSAGYGWSHSYCPGRYSCASLYGGYGPYGGAAFWSQYTYGGWQYMR